MRARFRRPELAPLPDVDAERRAERPRDPTRLEDPELPAAIAEAREPLVAHVHEQGLGKVLELRPDGRARVIALLLRRVDERRHARELLLLSHDLRVDVGEQTPPRLD